MNQRNLYSLLFILCFGCLAAQRNPQPHFRNYNTEDGLPSPEVYIAFEDSEGFMWFGTDNGVARFDGYEFKTYGPKEGLMSAVVFDIHEDHTGRLWFGTLSGEVFILGSERDTMVPYRFNEVLKGFEKKYDKVFLEGISEDGTCFFDVLNFGLLKIDLEGSLDSIVTEEVRSIMIYNLPSLQNPVASQSRSYNMPNYKSITWEQESANLTHLEIVSVGGKKQFFRDLEYSNYRGAGLEAQNISTGSLILNIAGSYYIIQDSMIVYETNRIFSSSEIVIIGESIWLCHLFKKGISKFNSEEAFKKKKFDSFLNGSSISNLLMDSKGGYWVTTLENGIFYTNNFNSVTYDERSGLSESQITTMVFKDSTSLFAGGSNMEIFEIDFSKKRLVQKIESGWNIDSYNLFYDQTRAILFFGFARYDGNQWVLPLGISSLSGEKFYSATTNLDALINLNKNELIGVRQTGILIYNINKNLIRYWSSPEVDNRTTAIFLDSQSALWVGNLQGIHQFSIKDTTYTSPNIDHPAFRSRVEDITELPDSTLAFATKGYGVMLWKGDDFRQISDEDGLTSNMLEDLHVDENGTLWAGTLNGLNKITFDSLGNPQVRTFTIQNGLPSNEIYQIKSQNDQVWLATGGGLVKFHEQPVNKNSPAPILQSVEVNDKERKALATSDFSHDENNFEFRYLAINYRMNGKIPYRYRIHHEDDWEYTQSRTVNYPSLPAGDYALEVQAQNEDRYWSEGTIYEFCILPPWWATSWFRFLMVALFLGLVYAFYRYRISQLEKENQIQNQITELEKSALQAQMNPHFIFNCLNSIQNFILQNDKKKAVEYLSRFAKLVRHNLNASVNGTISLDEEISLLENYLALEQQRFEGKFDYEVTASESLKEKYVEFPPMLIQPYVENAILHGISAKAEKGLIKISLSENEGLLIVKIKDDGVGYTNNVIGSTKHKSVGMTITKKRLALLEQNSNTPVQINPLVDKENNPNGTEVIIQITTKN